VSGFMLFLLLAFAYFIVVFYFFFIGFKAKMKALEDEINGIDLNQIRHESRVLAGVEGILDSYTFR